MIRVAALARLALAASALLVSVASAAPTPTSVPAPVSRAAETDAGHRPPRPKIGASWQWQLSGPLDPTVPADVYDIDGAGSTAADVARLHAAGRYVICYVNVGTIEDFRVDAGAFPRHLIGKPNGWPGERWLDIRQPAALDPVLAARLDDCASKDFDAVEPDNLDGYTNDTGFPLTAADQLQFNRHIAALAHARGLAVALKNDTDQVTDLVTDFDFAIVEECVRYQECNRYQPFINASKPVFAAEYETELHTMCTTTTTLHLNAIRKPAELTTPRETCQP